MVCFDVREAHAGGAAALHRPHPPSGELGKISIERVAHHAHVVHASTASRGEFGVNRWGVVVLPDELYL